MSIEGDSTKERKIDFNRETQAIWDTKAQFWDERMGAEGNLFQKVLIGPATERLLEVKPDQVVLEIACGNGVFSRRLAHLGAKVVAIDFSKKFLSLAQSRYGNKQEDIKYLLLDATDEEQLLTLGVGHFDAGVCNMALMDMSSLGPLASALTKLLKPKSSFVFSIPHPAFNNPAGTKLALEEEDRVGCVSQVFYVKVSDYLEVPPSQGTGILGEPIPHYYFHRSLSSIFGTFFHRGFILDGLEEPAFGPTDKGGGPLSWANYKNIPPVLVARMRLI